MRLYALALFQCGVILWLHFVALRRNLESLRVYIARHPPHHSAPDLWVDGGPRGYSFHLCPRCVSAVVAGQGEGP